MQFSNRQHEQFYIKLQNAAVVAEQLYCYRNRKKNQFQNGKDQHSFSSETFYFLFKITFFKSSDLQASRNDYFMTLYDAL